MCEAPCGDARWAAAQAGPAWGQAAYQAVPDPGQCLSRPRIQALMCSSGDRPLLLIAPSGYGKTVAAIQYARGFPGKVLWRSFQGNPVAPGKVISLLAAKRRDPSVDLLDSLDDLRNELRATESAPLLICLDDIAIEGAAAEGLLLIANGLRGLGVQFLVTAQSFPCSCRGLNDAFVLGSDHLRLTLDESERMLVHHHGVGVDGLREMHSESGGHPAILSLMLRAADLGSSGPLDVQQWIQRLVTLHFDCRKQKVLAAAALLGHGNSTDLELLGLSDARRLLEECAQSLPLVRVRTESAGAAFAVHEMAIGPVMEMLRTEQVPQRSELLSGALDLLSRRGDFGTCLRLLELDSDLDFQADWLTSHGQGALAAGLAPALIRLLESLPVQTVMASPELLLLWSRCSGECGDIPGALAKARAAYVLLEHSCETQKWLRAAALVVDHNRDLGRYSDALSVAAHVLPRCTATHGSASAELLRAYAATLVALGDYAQAGDIILEADHISDVALDPQLSERLDFLECLRLVLADGDFVAASRKLSRHAKLGNSSAKGNLGVALLEVGRLNRAEPLLRKYSDPDDPVRSAYYRAPLGLLLVARGRTDQGLCLVEEGIRLALQVGDESEAAASRVYQAMALRACGQVEAALVSAERAYEQLAHTDYMQFRRLAAIEVAASLLALGDEVVARRWCEPASEGGFGGNPYHGLRAAMVLAECDRRRGELELALSRVKPFSGHLSTENSNWQVAMYVRAFPHLLGLLATACGVRNLPSHMLRMILPQHAERSLRSCRSFMDSDEWTELGRRLLGDTQFDHLVARNGQPICHVRLFGGLDVSIDGRVVQEKDWRKRKARLLFAMLAVRRGADVPRDELLEALWPDLDDERGKNNFYVAWSAMKSALLGSAVRAEASPYTESARGRCRIVREAVRLDLDDFDEALADARAAEAAGDRKDAVAAYERLSAAYRGDLLPGDVYDDWFAPIRDSYKMQFIDAMTRATSLLLEADDPCEAVLFARRGLSVDPLREDLYQLALRCHIAAGQRSAAIDTFLQCRTNLGDELGLDPSGETMKLYQEVLAMEECPRPDSYGLS